MADLLPPIVQKNIKLNLLPICGIQLSFYVNRDCGWNNFAEFDDPIVGKHGLRVCICENGKDNSSKQEVFINMREITRGSADRELSRARVSRYPFT